MKAHLFPRTRLGWLAVLLPALILALVLVPATPQVALAANPAPFETYFVPLPDDWLMQHMEDIDDTGGSVGDPYPPVRSVIGISISAENTLIYWDQWEDGSYDSDIANPGGNVYNAATNPAGTQIWGDGDPSNGYPPRFRDDVNIAQRDLLQAGDVIVLDNLVPIYTNPVGGTVHGPWFYGNHGGRLATEVRFDGRDKFGATYPVAATRAGWSEGDIDGIGTGIIAAGSMFSDATAIEPTSKWGTSFVVPIGLNPPGMTTPFDYAHLTVQASVANTTVCVDTDPATTPRACDLTATIAAGEQYDPTPVGTSTTPQGVVAGAEVWSTDVSKPVQVVLVTGDVSSTWATRWYNLKPFAQWTNDYYQPVGTAGAASAVWVYNPNSKQITITITRPSGTGSATCNPKSSCKMPNIPAGEGGHGVGTFTDGTGPAIFYAVSVTEATGAQLYDWGYSLIPSSALTDQALVGWAPGCTTFLGPNECFDLEPSNNGTGDVQGRSRTPVWVTSLANTTIYVDLDGSGVDCNSTPVGTGAERTVAATALTSNTLVDDPAEIVRDEFSAQVYNNNNSPTGENWNTNWSETGETTSSTAGAIQIVSSQLRFQDYTGGEVDHSIQRTEGIAAPNTKAWFSFILGSSTGLDASDRLAVEVSSSTSGPWTVLETLSSVPSPNPTFRQYDISAFISANTTVRLRIVDDLETGDYWYVDNVTLAYGTGQSDFDMSGTRLRTCDGTKIAVAWGQQPSLSYSGDEEALDMGTVVFPLGSNISLEKSVNKSWVTPGGEVIYTFKVQTTAPIPLSQVSVSDNYCAPATYASGDDGDSYLETGETWLFTCTARIYVDTVNTAVAKGTPDGGNTFIQSAPDQERVRVTGAIGDYVWVDEDGDGDQDAGEPGIPNVKVTLTGTDFAGSPVSFTTYTDANGGYVFSGLPPSNAAGYIVTVDTTTLPAGLAANQTYDENGVGTPNTTTVVLNSGVEWMTADFGYNWSSPCETNTPGAAGCTTPTGAIGDRVWIDADGEGDQDPNEVGVAGVTVQLITAGTDGRFGTFDDVVAATTTTNANGNYIFDGLAAGAYVVNIATPPAGYTQTGDPDGTPDNKTTDPVVLGPGDVYLNADFGYMPGAGTFGTIGDTVWLDANRDNTQNAGENGIPGVTVALIKDLNGNGVWDLGEPIIATDITDESGVYGFSGLPVTDGGGTDDYLVWVNDTANVLNELDPTYDVRDGASQGNPTTGLVTGLTISAVTDLTTTAVTNADFAYAPPGQDAGEGIIGDTIFLDRDGGDDFDPGEGLEGIVVELLNSSGNVIARTVTDENGHYTFGGLPAGTYTVRVVTATLPSAGLTNTVDPDGGTPNQSTVVLAAGGINLAQDFGYRPPNPNTIGGTIWEDVNADGTKSGENKVFPGVTVALYADTNGNGVLDAGDKLVGTTTTDSNGDYSFTGLPNGTYFVDVTDDANELNGYWKSNGPNAGADNNSQLDPYKVTVTGGQTNTTGDFGYYLDPGALGNRVWHDQNKDGIQDAGEPGIAGAVVTLVITYPNGDTTTLVTTTDANGYYEFGNLLLDEDYDGVGTAGASGTEPSFRISVATPAGFVYSSPQNQTPNEAADSDNPAGEPATTTQGSVNEIYDFGYYQTPLGVTLAGLAAELTPDGVTITWETVSELNNAGFNLYRAESAEGPWTRLNETLIATLTPGSGEGHAYLWQDAAGETDRILFYQLEDVALDGTTALHDPISVAPLAPTAVSLSGLAAAPLAATWPALGGLAALFGLAVAGYARRRRRD